MDSIFKQHTPKVHIRFEGQSWQAEAQLLNISDRSSDEEVKCAVAHYLDVSPTRFAAYVVERHANGNITVRPEAIFG
jgi:hypothetical protein